MLCDAKCDAGGPNQRVDTIGNLGDNILSVDLFRESILRYTCNILGENL